MNTVTQSDEIETFCIDMQKLYEDLARPITEDDPRLAELGPHAAQFTAEERGQMYALHHDTGIEVPPFVTVPAWARWTKVSFGTFPEVTVSFEAEFGHGDMAATACTTTVIFAADIENCDGTVDHRGTIDDNSDTIEILLPEARNQARVSDLIEAQANVNALVDHLRSTGVML